MAKAEMNLNAEIVNLLDHYYDLNSKSIVIEVNGPDKQNFPRDEND